LSQLTLYSQFNMRKPYLISSDIEDVAGHLAADGIEFEQWQLRHEKDCRFVTESDLLRVYQSEIEKVKADRGYRCFDLVCIGARESQMVSLRDKFLSEHTHTEDEVRFFLSGKALYYIHAKERIHIVQCGAGDFIRIPKGVKHWFDMGPRPEYCCLRWFDSDAGLDNQYTGTYVAESTPRWESVIGE